MKMEKILKGFHIDKPGKFRLADYDPADTCGLTLEDQGACDARERHRAAGAHAGARH
jgi:hypothetical protein